VKERCIDFKGVRLGLGSQNTEGFPLGSTPPRQERAEVYDISVLGPLRIYNITTYEL